MNISTKHIKKLAKNTDEMMALCYEFLHKEAYSVGGLHLCPTLGSYSFFDKEFQPFSFTNDRCPCDHSYTFEVTDFTFHRENREIVAWPQFIRKKLREISPKAEMDYVEDFYKARETELKEMTKGFNATTDRIIGGYRYVDKVLGD